MVSRKELLERIEKLEKAVDRLTELCVEPNKKIVNEKPMDKDAFTDYYNNLKMHANFKAGYEFDPNRR